MSVLSPAFAVEINKLPLSQGSLADIDEEGTEIN
jgi:hypothetical protein